MEVLQRKNNAKSLVTNNPLTAGATTVTVTTGEGTKFPSTGDFLLTIWNSTQFPDPGDDPIMEIVRATSRTGDTITITRAQEDTSASEHPLNSTIAMVITAGSFDKFMDDEVPSGDINGSNPDFVLDNTPVTGTLKVFVNGARLKATSDYTLTSSTITLATPPPSGSTIVCDYRYV